MERVGVLIAKLQEQYQQQVSPASLMLTAQMLMRELEMQPEGSQPPASRVAVMVPGVKAAPAVPEPEAVRPAAPPKPAPAQPAAPKPPAAPVIKEESPASVPVTPWYQQSTAEIPTLRQYEKDLPAREEPSLNDTLKENKTELAAVLQEAPIRDLRKAIGINDRYLFINELFRGDETTFERSIKTINDFKIFAEAEYWIKRELKLKYGWNEESEAVKAFDQLVRRRFS